MGDHDATHLSRFRDLPDSLPKLPETLGSEVTGREHGPVLHPVRTDLLQAVGKRHQGFAGMGGNVASSGLAALHGDGAAGEEEMNHPDGAAGRRGGAAATPPWSIPRT
jgi:hypothetical protein